MRNEGKSICNCCGRVLEQEEYINIEINFFKAHLKYSNEKCDKLLSNVK